MVAVLDGLAILQDVVASSSLVAQDVLQPALLVDTPGALKCGNKA
jgi:hypothetical protein